jgi:hypothetical protein
MAVTLACARWVLVVSWLAWIPACGALGHDEPPGPVFRDARTGFVDGPGIEVCMDGTRVVAPSRAAGGALSFCVSPGVASRTCDDTTECAPGERCVCGRCGTRPCRNATECDAGEVCVGNRCASVCGSDTDCRAGETCSAGGCARRCSTQVDCAYGEKCSALDGTCIVKLCGDAVSCNVGEPCAPLERVADLREPHGMTWGGQALAFVEIRDGSACAVYRARVVSPRRWEVDPLQPVLAPENGEGGCVGAPSVVAEPGRLVMYAARGDGSAIVRASSVDGSTFLREPTPVVTPTEDWQGGWVGAPGAARFQGATRLFYQADRGRAIGLASIDEATGTLLDIRPTPVISPSMLEDPLFWRGVQRVTSPFAVERDGALLLYVAARGAEQSDAQVAAGGVYPADVNDSIGLLASRDLVAWDRFPTGPVLARRTNLRTYLGELEPAVMFLDGGAWLVYVGADASGVATTGLGLATSGP